jgi:hypothetical protein
MSAPPPAVGSTAFGTTAPEKRRGVGIGCRVLHDFKQSTVCLEPRFEEKMTEIYELMPEVKRVLSSEPKKRENAVPECRYYNRQPRTTGALSLAGCGRLNAQSGA